MRKFIILSALLVITAVAVRAFNAPNEVPAAGAEAPSFKLIIDPVTGTEVDRHTFESRKTIKPGRGNELLHFSITRPTKVVTAGALENADARRPFTERVIVKKIIYADRSFWRRV